MNDPTALSDITFCPELSFEEKVIRVLNFQLKENPVYRTFYETLIGQKQPPEDILEIPLLPIRAFSVRKIVAGGQYYSSTLLLCVSRGRSGSRRSTHVVADPALSERSVVM